MPSFLQIVSQTPVWVWPLLLVLLWLGLSGIGPRVVPIWRPALLPLIGLGLSLTGVVQSALPTLALSSWLAALLLGFGPGYALGRRRTVRLLPKGRLELSGGWFGLVFGLSVFFVRYALGVLFGVLPALRSELLWAALSAGLGGAIAGIGLGWLAAVLARARRNALVADQAFQVRCVN